MADSGILGFAIGHSGPLERFGGWGAVGLKLPGVRSLQRSARAADFILLGADAVASRLEVRFWVQSARSFGGNQSWLGRVNGGQGNGRWAR